MKSLNLKTIENDLILLKTRLIDRVDLLSRDKKRKSGPVPQSFGEQAIALKNDEVVDELDELGNIELRDIDSALARIKKGNFGECISCGGKIPVKRLSAIPYASQCLSCASENSN